MIQTRSSGASASPCPYLIKATASLIGLKTDSFNYLLSAD
jgi:hypothetical protein